MIRRLLIKVLLRLLEGEIHINRKSFKTDDVDKWLADSWPHKGFQEYINFREQRIERTLAGGEGMNPEPRQAYMMHIGQRFENLYLALRAKKSYNTLEQERKKRLLASERT